MKYTPFLLIFLLSGCASYEMHGKRFHTQHAALTYQQGVLHRQIEGIQRSPYIGGSIMVHIPSDANLQQAPFVTGNAPPHYKQYFLQFYKNDFLGIAEALSKTGAFASVRAVQTSGYLRYAKDHGYRYLLVNNGDQTFTVFDLSQNIDKTIRLPKGLNNLAYLVEDTISKFEASTSSTQLGNKFQPTKEEYAYDDRSGKGFISVQGKGLEARAWMMSQIGDICSSKNIKLKAGERPEAGFFVVTDEILSNGILTIHFESLY